MLQHDPSRNEAVLNAGADEDGVGVDDAADALRYLMATKARAVVQCELGGVIDAKLSCSRSRLCGEDAGVHLGGTLVRNSGAIR